MKPLVSFNLYFLDGIPNCFYRQEICAFILWYFYKSELFVK